MPTVGCCGLTFPCESNEYDVTPVVMEPAHRRYARADAFQHLSLSGMSYCMFNAIFSKRAAQYRPKGLSKQAKCACFFMLMFILE